MNPFRFAVQTSHAPDAATWRQRARDAESMGYSTLYVPDHFGEQWGPLVGVTLAAEATETIRVGWLVLDNDFRHPMELAKEVATLDLATEGRVEFGLGAGWMRTDYDQSGISYDAPGVRVDRMEESLHVLKQLWAGGPVDFQGEHYTLTGAVNHPQPHSKPHPPIVVGGGSKRVLSIAAREADVVGFNTTLRSGEAGREAAAAAVADRFDERVQWVRDAAGERFDQLELQCHTSFVVVTDDRRGVAGSMAGIFGVDADQALQVPIVIVGNVDEICADLQERRERWGFSYWVIPSDAMESFAPVVQRLSGS